MELRSGERFAGRYDLERELGRGGMGTVFAARHAFTGRRVALKVLHDFVSTSKTARERFLREAQASAAIGHPSIVEVLDAGEEGGALYLAMELLEGRDLGLVLQGYLSTEELLQIGVELLGALDAAHRGGLVHRDIKPENVFVLDAPRGGARVRLVDFGISGLVPRNEGEPSSLTVQGTILGTPHYMSPEQARGERVDGRADLWAVGAILYTGLTGRHPYEAPSYNLLIHKILTEPVPSLAALRPELGPALAEVIDRALERDLARRWPTAAAMRDALAACSVPRAESRPAPASGGSLAATGARPPDTGPSSYAPTAHALPASPLPAIAPSGSFPPTAPAMPATPASSVRSLAAQPTPAAPSAPPLASSPGPAPDPAARSTAPGHAQGSSVAPAPSAAAPRPVSVAPRPASAPGAVAQTGLGSPRSRVLPLALGALALLALGTLGGGAVVWALVIREPAPAAATPPPAPAPAPLPAPVIAPMEPMAPLEVAPPAPAETAPPAPAEVVAPRLAPRRIARPLRERPVRRLEPHRAPDVASAEHTRCTQRCFMDRHQCVTRGPADSRTVMECSMAHQRCAESCPR